MKEMILSKSKRIEYYNSLSINYKETPLGYLSIDLSDIPKGYNIETLEEGFYKFIGLNKKQQ